MPFTMKRSSRSHSPTPDAPSLHREIASRFPSPTRRGEPQRAPGAGARVVCSPCPEHRPLLESALAGIELPALWPTELDRYLEGLSHREEVLLVVSAGPEGEGPERLRDLRRRLEGRDFEILLIADRGRGRAVERWVRAGADEVFLLPGEPEALAERLSLLSLRVSRRGLEGKVRGASYPRAEPHLRWAMEQLPSLLWATDLRLHLTSLFGAGIATFEPDSEGSLDATVYHLFGTDDAEFPPIAAALKAISGEASSFEFEWLGQSFEGRVEPLTDRRRRVVGCMGFALDVSERRETENALVLQEAYFQQLFESSPQAIVMVDPEDRLLKANRGFEELFGYREGELRGEYLGASIIPPAYREEGEALSEAVLAGNIVQTETVRRHRSGREIQTAILGYPIRLGRKVIGVFGIYDDITERKQTEERLRHEALHDSLTGLPNRSLFVDRVAHCLSRRERERGVVSAVLFLDLDRFKLINDSLGHSLGDQLLVAIADRLAASMRSMDTVARLGGDEFVILLEEVSELGDAVRFAHRIQSTIAAPFDLADTEVFVTASIGIALSGPSYRQPGELIRDADTAMYRAKAQGRACHAVFDRQMHARAMRRLQLETDLRRGLDRREFCLHYQPIVDLGSGEIECFEALIRWQHPLRGLLQPAEFLEVAEETGLTVDLGAFVLDEACRQVRRWLDGKSGVGICVNLSAKQFLQPDLPAQVDTLLESFSLPPHSLRLEITEGVILTSTASIVESFDALKAGDIRLYLDDFGTGYSSLAYLETFPFDSLKIDRSFVSGGPGKGGKPEIVQAIVRLAHSLGLEVVAEGIETSEQLAWVRALGCEQGQGFYFSPPLTGSEATALLVQKRSW